MRFDLPPNLPATRVKSAVLGPLSIDCPASECNAKSPYPCGWVGYPTIHKVRLEKWESMTNENAEEAVQNPNHRLKDLG
jgi:hypothetical protein